MKKIYLANILVFLSAFSVGVTADDTALMPAAAAPSTSSSTTSSTTTTTTTDTTTSSTGIDPTLAFFSALSSCTAGSYQEKNIISAEVGQQFLNQTIVGPSQDQLTCNVTLSTPDNRTMNCQFPMESLSMFNDQHFMQGMLADTTDSPSQDSVTADMSWSQLKAENCSFTQ